MHAGFETQMPGLILSAFDMRPPPSLISAFLTPVDLAALQACDPHTPPIAVEFSAPGIG